jgi:hypothetical protein
VLYLPVAGVVRLRIVRRFPDGWVLVTSSRQTDLSYWPSPNTYLQVRRGGTVADLWAWHLAAEELFPSRSVNSKAVVPSPIEVYVELARRNARDYQRVWLWFLRYDPVGELWRILRRRDVSVQRQIERGWATDPTMTFPDPDGWHT